MGGQYDNGTTFETKAWWRDSLEQAERKISRPRPLRRWSLKLLGLSRAIACVWHMNGCVGRVKELVTSWAKWGG
jgi:hypothetical protein